jgi:hypothetical protein
MCSPPRLACKLRLWKDVDVVLLGKCAMLAVYLTLCALLVATMGVAARVVTPNSLGAALHYFTGSKAHNIAIRKMGVERKLKINEYGVFQGRGQVAGATEAEVYALFRILGHPIGRLINQRQPCDIDMARIMQGGA